MATPYNHKAIEQKWRKNWEENPVNVQDGTKPKYIAWICSLILQAVVCMQDIGEVTLFLMFGVVIK